MKITQTVGHGGSVVGGRECSNLGLGVEIEHRDIIAQVRDWVIFSVESIQIDLDC